MAAPTRTAPDRRRRDIQILADIAALSTRDLDLRDLLTSVATLLRDGCGLIAVGVLVRQDDDYELEVVAGPEAAWRGRQPHPGAIANVLKAAVAYEGPWAERALAERSPTARGATSEAASMAAAARDADHAAPDHGAGEHVTGEHGPTDDLGRAAPEPPHDPARAAVRGTGLTGVCVPIEVGEGEPWGRLAAAGDARTPIGHADVEVLRAAAAELGVAISRNQLLAGLSRQLRKSEALLTISADISSKLDLGQILSGLLDYALVLFGADRGGVFLVQSDGSLRPDAVRNLSATYLASLRAPTPGSLPAEAIAARQPRFAVHYSADTRAETARERIDAEGYDTICAAPLFDAGGLLGLLAIYHDDPHEWAAEDLDTMAALATQAAVAIRTAQNFSQMATWAAQLQSIQHLGARLSRLKTVQEIAAAIASELRQLIDYQNIRVYRVGEGRKLMPVALHGRALEYLGETPEALVVEWGEGITGWVAEHGVAQYLPDAAHDARTVTIPGTDDDVDESILAAPMTFEGRVLGVLVLSKLGLRQFGDDDLRLLRIYASFAAQAMANADATERLRAQASQLERQLRSQRELLQITESILGSLDAEVIVNQITERLYEIVHYDAAVVELADATAQRPIQVAERRVRDEPCADGPDAPAPAPSVLEMPIHARGGVTGLLRLTRYGDQPTFTLQEVELVRLFAAHVAIALQNAEVHREVEIRAQTDALTGLLSRGSFSERLTRVVEAGEQFSLIMLDLDDFKIVNDRMGHQAGDRFLRQIAAAIVGAARDTDVVFRYGGDEFAVLLPRTEPEGARLMAERVQEALHGVRAGRRSRDTRGTERRRPEVSASIGIATFPEDGGTPDEILLAADRACYVAKRGGRNRIAVAEEGRALAEEFQLQEPTPVDEPTLRGRAV